MRLLSSARNRASLVTILGAGFESARGSRSHAAQVGPVETTPMITEWNTDSVDNAPQID
jgi:hypothetical protein